MVQNIENERLCASLFCINITHSAVKLLWSWLVARLVYVSKPVINIILCEFKAKWLYQFSGQMLLNWFVSSITDNTHLKTLLSVQDLRNLGIQYCTHLLAAGVLRQISDKDAPTENVFKVLYLTFIALQCLKLHHN